MSSGCTHFVEVFEFGIVGDAATSMTCRKLCAVQLVVKIVPSSPLVGFKLGRGLR